MDIQQSPGPTGSKSVDKEGLKLSCPFCKKPFARNCDLKRHQPICSLAPEGMGKEAERFQCDHCEATFRRKGAKSQHMKKNCIALKPVNLDPKKMQCPNCSVWLQKRHLNQHLNTYCKITTKSMERIPCLGCRATFKTQFTLQRHQGACPGNNAPKTTVSCPKCSKKMGKSSLSQHVKSCSGPKLLVVKTYKCLKCPKVCKSSNARAQHKYYCKGYNLGKEFHCPHCKKRSANEITLKKHIANYCAAIKEAQKKSGEPMQYKCDHCSRTSSSKLGIYVHMLRSCQASQQAKEKRLGIKVDLTCHDCSATFKSRVTLYHHRHYKYCKVGRELRLQFQCQHCRKKFMAKDTLGGHMRYSCRKARINRQKKDGKRTFVQCRFCKRRFWNKKYLHHHRMQPIRKYNRSRAAGHPMPQPKCHLCGEEFPATCMLKKHIVRLCPVKLAVPKYKRYVFGKKFIARQKLIHPYKNNFPCSECGYIAEKFDEITNHMKTSHNFKFDESNLEVPDPKGDNGNHICFVCAKEYHDYELTRDHISYCFEDKFVYFLSKPQIADKKKIAPDGGDELVSATFSRKTHKKRQTKSRCKILKLIGDSNEMYYPCFLCGFISNELENIKSHLKSDHRYNADNLEISEPESSDENNNCRFKCFLCNKAFFDYELTREHIECCLDDYI